MSQFFMRIANYIANELIVKGLSNNRQFQRFALRTADHMDKVKTQGVQHGEKMSKEVEKHVGLVGRFVAALQKEVKKDLDKFSKKG